MPILLPNPAVVVATGLPDVEAICATALRTAAIAGGRVYSSVPKSPTFPMIVVRRDGGTPVVRQRLDAPVIVVEVWGTSKSEAHDAAQAARVALLALEGTSVTSPSAAVVVAVNDARGLTWQPDASTGRDRYFFAMSVYARGGQ